MNLTINELRIIERLLSNRLNADFEPETDELLHKIREEINERNYQFNRSMKWCGTGEVVCGEMERGKGK